MKQSIYKVIQSMFKLQMSSKNVEGKKSFSTFNKLKKLVY